MSEIEMLGEVAFRRLLSWDIDLSDVQQSAREVRSESLKEPVRAFLYNLENIDALRLMPFLIAGEGVRRFYWTLHYIRGGMQLATAVIKGERISGEGMETVLSQAARIDRANQIFLEFVEDKDSVHEVAALIDDTLRALMQLDSFRKSIETSAMMAVPAAWTAFECLARDVWIAAINSGDVALAQRAFRGVDNLGQEDGITNKHVEVGLLARYQFDLRNRVGTILAQKFKFSDTRGVEHAYIAAFEDRGILSRIFGDRNLQLLEKTRHLIVHQGAVVDARFRKETGSEQSIGERLVLSGQMLADYIRSVVNAGSALIQFADSWLTTQR